MKHKSIYKSVIIGYFICTLSAPVFASDKNNSLLIEKTQTDQY